MTVNNNGSFICENQFFFKGTELERNAAKYLEQAICALQPHRRLQFAFQVEGLNGTVDKTPLFRVRSDYESIDECRKTMEGQLANERFMYLLQGLRPYNESFSRTYYRPFSFTNPSPRFSTVWDALDDAEAERMRAESLPLSDLEDQEARAIQPHPFSVQTLITAKPECVAIARKIALFIITLDSSQKLFFPFQVKEVYEGKGGSVGSQPTLAFEADYLNMDDYRQRAREKLDNPLLREAYHLLNICMQTFSRQFFVDA